MSTARNGLQTGLTLEEVVDCIRKEAEFVSA